MAPVVGEVADAANALIYTARGDYANAVLSAAATIPFAGWAATGGKLASKALKLVPFNSVESVIQSAGKLIRKKGGIRLGRITGNAENVFTGLSKQYGAKINIVDDGHRFFESGRIRVDLTSSSEGIPTLRININKGEELYKIRVNQ